VNRLGLLFGDAWAEDTAPVDLDCRVDDFRAINSITLRQLIGSHLENGRNFFPALFDRPAAPSQIISRSRAPVAQLDRASGKQPKATRKSKKWRAR